MAKLWEDETTHQSVRPGFVAALGEAIKDRYFTAEKWGDLTGHFYDDADADNEITGQLSIAWKIISPDRPMPMPKDSPDVQPAATTDRTARDFGTPQNPRGRTPRGLR